MKFTALVYRAITDKLQFNIWPEFNEGIKFKFITRAYKLEDPSREVLTATDTMAFFDYKKRRVAKVPGEIRQLFGY